MSLLKRLWEVFNKPVFEEVPHYIRPDSPILKTGRWIRNIREACCYQDGSADMGGADGAICCTCGFGLARFYDTTCFKCGDTSCYHDSFVDAQHIHWFCSKCKPADAINADSPEYSTGPRSSYRIDGKVFALGRNGKWVVS